MATTITSKKSEALTEKEIQELKDFRNRFDTATEAAIQLRISREVLLRVLLAGSGSPKTIKTIRASLKRAVVTE